MPTTTVTSPPTPPSVPTLQGMLDLGEPVAIIATGVLHHLDALDRPSAVLAELHDATVAGSYLVVSHLCSDSRPREMATLAGLHADASIWLVPRTRRDIEGLLAGWDLLPPGLVSAPDWHPEEPDSAACSADSCLLAAVARHSGANQRPKPRGGSIKRG